MASQGALTGARLAPGPAVLQIKQLTARDLIKPSAADRILSPVSSR
jgi:hypothetical protein